MGWFRRNRTELCKADLDNLARHLTETLELTEQRLLATMRPRPKRSGSALAAAMAAAVAVASGLGGYGFYTLGQSGTPTAADPGRIGVAVIGGSSLPLQVVGRFFADSSAVQLAVTDITGRADLQRAPRIVIYLCGNIRRDAQISDPNRGALTLQPLPDSAIVSDSRLGDRRACSYAVDEFTNGFQSILSISTSRPTSVRSGSNILYTLPGLTTLLIDEELEGSTVHPLNRGSTIDVALGRVPVDLTVTASRPQIPPSGQLVWSSPISDPGLPDSYRVTGFLGGAGQSAQTRIFVAGALVGVCGAAILWFLESVGQIITRRSQSRSQN